MSRNWRFWCVTVAALVGMGATFSLGQWQLSRADQKLAIQAQREARLAQPPLSGATLKPGLEAVQPEWLDRQLVLRGRWLSQHTVYLDNRQMQGRPGFYVLTPLALDNSPTVVLVQRGWVPRNFEDRTRLPELRTPADAVEVSGRIAPAPSKLYELGESGTGAIRQNLDLADFSRETGLALAGIVLVQTDPSSDGLLRDWPVIASGVDKHHGYAFQWFGLCALMAILYVWFQFVQPWRQRRR